MVPSAMGPGSVPDGTVEESEEFLSGDRNTFLDVVRNPQ